jgi:chitin synthase
VVNLPIPEAILNQIAHAQPSERDEFTHSRFQTATCEPSEFWDQNYILRCRLFAKPRNTELLVVVPISGTDRIAFAKTVHAIIRELMDLGSKKDFR